MMMKTRRGGFTLVEMLVVAVLATLVMGAVYRTLIVQEQSSRASGAMIRDNDALRTALGILESELREVSTTGTAIGGRDIAIANSDSIVFRAQRKIAILCEVHNNERRFDAAMISDNLVAGDSLLIFVDNVPTSWQDDAWRAAQVQGTQNSSTTPCITGAPIRRVNLTDAANLIGVLPGAPVRSFEWVTYAIYDFGHLGWALGRRQGDGPARYLVNGFGAPGQGLRFDYFDADNQATTDPAQVARIQVTARTAATAQRPEPAEMTTNLFLRNN